MDVREERERSEMERVVAVEGASFGHLGVVRMWMLMLVVLAMDVDQLWWMIGGVAWWARIGKG